MPRVKFGGLCWISDQKPNSFHWKKLDENFNIQTRVKGLQCNLLFFGHIAPFFDYRGGGCSQKSLTQQSPDSTFAFPESENNQCPVRDRQDH